MPRRPRIDYAGAFHHVYNRGAARRTVFETADDARSLQDELANVVEAGLLEVHAFSLLTTHYHLLVSSPCGELSEAMRRVGNRYVRRFNRERRRDGALLRGRFGSRLVSTSAYFEAVLRYVDRNPVGAGISRASHLHPHGSAWHYARSERPSWLTTSRVETLVAGVLGVETFRPELYPLFDASTSWAQIQLVEARSSAPQIPDDPLDDLVRAAPLAVQSWMETKSRLADGSAPAIVLLAASSITAVLHAMDLDERTRRSLTAGLLHTMAGCTAGRIAAELHCSAATAHRAARAHDIALLADSRYAACAAEIVHTVIRRDFGNPRRLFDLPRRVPDPRIAVEDTMRGFVSR
jgi:REP element-mobilizing transposase RayT